MTVVAISPTYVVVQ